MAFSAFALFRPTQAGPSLFEGADKVAHAVIFLLVAATTRWRFGARVTAAAGVVAYAVVSEVVQGALLAHRSGDPLDVVADLVGAAAGWELARRLLRR